MHNRRPLTILSLADRDYSEDRYSTSHPVLEDIFARLLPEHGHRVVWLLHSAQATRGGASFSWHGSTVHLLPSGGASRYRKQRHMLWRRLHLRGILGELVRELKVDVIQIRNDWIAALAARDVQRRYNTPVIFQWSFPHPLTYSARAADGLTRSRSLAQLRTRLEQSLYDQALHSATHVLPISKWMLQALVRRGVPAEKMTPFPLGFNTAVTPAGTDGQAIRSRYAPDGEPLVLYFGEMGRLRRLEFLLQAMRQVVDKVPAARLLMVGGGDSEADIQHLVAVADRLCLSQHVHFTGFVPRSEIPRFIRAADVAVSPIRPIPLYALSSPTKLVEALGMACPVVANDIPEQHEVLIQSGGGLCVPYETTAFARAIIWLLEHPEQARAIGQKGRAYVEAHRSLSSMTDTLEDLYYRLIRPT